MAANILNNARAVQMSVFVVRALVEMRELLGGTKELARQLADRGCVAARHENSRSATAAARTTEAADWFSRRAGRKAESQTKEKGVNVCPHIATMEADPMQSLQPGRRHWLHPAQRAAPESRGEGAEEEIKHCKRT